MLLVGLLDAVRQDESLAELLEPADLKRGREKNDILNEISGKPRDPRVFSRKRKQKRSQDNASLPRSAKNSRRPRSGILGAPQQDSQSSLHHSNSVLQQMAPRFLKSPSGQTLSKSKDYIAEPIPAAISARYLKMKKREDYLRGSIEKDSRLSSQSPRATRIEQLFASSSQNSGLNMMGGSNSVQHSYTLQHQLKMPKHKIGYSGLNSNSNPNLAMPAAGSTSKLTTSRMRAAVIRDHSGIQGTESASKSWKKPPNMDALKKLAGGSRKSKTPSVQSVGSGNLRNAAQLATEAISSQSKLKLTSLFLSNLHSPTQAKTSRDRRNATNNMPQMDNLSQGGRMMRLTVTSGKNSGPLVQINNIVGDVKETTNINRGVMNSSSAHNILYDGSQQTANNSSQVIQGLGSGKVRPAKSSKLLSGGKQLAQKRSRSRKSPSLELQSMEMEKTHMSPKPSKKASHYDKQAIANYLQKNRLVNL